MDALGTGVKVHHCSVRALWAVFRTQLTREQVVEVWKAARIARGVSDETALCISFPGDRDPLCIDSTGRILSDDDKKQLDWRSVYDSPKPRVTRLPHVVYDARKATCSACDKWSDGRCTVCGCSTASKLANPAEQCPHPDGPKWQKWTEQA